MSRKEVYLKMSRETRSAILRRVYLERSLGSITVKLTENQVDDLIDTLVKCWEYFDDRSDLYLEDGEWANNREAHIAHKVAEMLVMLQVPN